MLRKRLRSLRQWMENEKIERYAFIIAHMHISGDAPEDTTYKEFSEIAIWDAIGRRVGELLEEEQKRVGVTGIIDSSVALKPREE